MRIESIADKQVKHIEEMQYMKYNTYFKQVVAILRKEKVLLYGGTAINSLLPKKYKFYPEASLPDIDIFARNAKKVATRIVRIFEERGHKYASMREALHENTFKVFIEGVQILDITHVDAATYKILAKGKKKTDIGLYTTNPEFLRMTLHQLMSQPFDAYRWPKVYERIQNFYTAFPIKACKDLTFKKFHIDADIVATFREWVNTKKYIYVDGAEVRKMYFNIPSIADDDRKSILVTGDNVATIAQEFIALLPKALRDTYGISVSDVSSHNDTLMSPYVYITQHGKRIFGIFSVNTCTSYVKKDTLRIASFHTLCSFFLRLTFIEPSVSSHQCMSQNLGIVQVDMIKHPTKKKVLEQFVLECYGPHEGQITLRRKQLERANKAHRK
jgi:hypothetical protein